MSCVGQTEVIEYLNDQLTPERAAAFKEHFNRCQTCRSLKSEIFELTNRLAPDAGEFDNEEFAKDVMTLVRLGQARPDKISSKQTSLYRLFWIPAVCATAIALAIALPGLLSIDKTKQETVTSQFQARGVKGLDAKSWCSIKVFRSTQDGFERVGDEFSKDDSLAFAYVNRAETQFAYLMVFAVDESENIFWYYPANEMEGENPTSIPIEQGETPQQLPHAVKHNLLEGGLKMIALFSRNPLDVQSVEKTVRYDLDKLEDKRNYNGPNLEDSTGHILSLKVLARSFEQDM